MTLLENESRLHAVAATIISSVKTLGIRSALSVSASYGRSLIGRRGAVRRVYISSIKRAVSLRPADMGTFADVFLQRQYALDQFPRHAAALEAYASKQASRLLIIDCGANIGLSALWFSRQFPTAAIYAVEPATPNLTLLQENVRGLPNVHPIIGAVWHDAGTVAINYDEDNPPGAQVTSEGPSKIRSYTISEVIEMAGGVDPLIVKIDIEGAEKNLFSGNTEWVSRTGLIVMEAHDWLFPFQGISRQFWACIGQNCFDVVHAGDNVFCFNHKIQAS